MLAMIYARPRMAGPGSAEQGHRLARDGVEPVPNKGVASMLAMIYARPVFGHGETRLNVASS